MSGGSVDAHQHFWRLARGDYAWLTPDLDALYRDFSPADLAPLMTAERVARTIVVQAAPTVAETRFLLSLADENPFIAGVVGWVDFESPAAAETLAELARHPRFVGVRPMIQDIADPDWMLADALTPVFEALVGHGLVFDALVRPLHLPRLRRLARRHRTLSIVVDHAAKPDLASGDVTGWRSWSREIAALAAESAATCKLSGLVTEAAADWCVDDLRPTVEHLLACFGAPRLMWGSDWPVVELAGGYRAWAGATRALLADLDPAGRGAVLGGVATRVYRLSPAPQRALP